MARSPEVAWERFNESARRAEESLRLAAERADEAAELHPLKRTAFKAEAAGLRDLADRTRDSLYESTLRTPGEKTTDIRACGDDHNLAVWFTPAAVREHLENHDEPEPHLGTVTDAALAREARDLLFMGEKLSDDLWETFDLACHTILDRAAEPTVGKRD